jgi:hypothetical protein
MRLTIHDFQIAEPEILAAAIQRAQSFTDASSVDLFITPRVALDAPPHRHPGWIEYMIRVNYPRQPLHIGCIQRSPGEQIEFHS